MKRKTAETKPGRTRSPAALIALLAVALSLLLAACGGGEKSPSVEELKTYRELSWEGTELTVKLGTNKGTGCEWENAFGDDTIIDYSINRKFTLSGKGAAQGQTVGILSAGFKGKREGETTITFTTPCDWDGAEPGYTYVVTVRVASDGTIKSAVGQEVQTPESLPQDGAAADEYAGTYTFLYMKISADMMIQMLGYDGEPAQNVPAQYVQMPNMTGWTVTLEPDGTGSLFWGEDNQGPIDQWTVDGGRLTFHAGVSEAEGTVKDGVMELALEEGLNAFFALPDAESTGVTPITPEDYFLLLYGGEQ